MRDRLIPPPKLLWQDKHFTVLVDDPPGVVRTVRSAVPFASIEEVDVVMGALCHALDGLVRSRFALLVDIRAAPGRNDPSFEAAMARHRRRWLGGFRRVGVLLQSVVGALQIQRFARQDGIERLIGNDEAELLKYLL